MILEMGGGMYTEKNVSHIPVPSRYITDQTLPGREKLNYSHPGRVWSVTFRLGTGKRLTLFYSVLYLAAGVVEAGTGGEGPTTAVPGVVCRTRGARAGRDP
jgi:hypothetical protein